MSEPIIIKPFSSATWPRFAGLIAAATVTALGLAVIIGWHAHWGRMLQVFPDAAPMQYNTALCFVACGAGLILLHLRLVGAAFWISVAVAFFTILTLLEFLTGGNFGIDQLLFTPYFQVATAYPGRMAPLTAICFILFGSALSLASGARRHLRSLAFAGLLATIIAVIGLIALLGYLTGMKLAYGWGAYSLMAFSTSIAFLILGIVLLLWSWQTAAQQNYHFVQWVPIAASATLLVMVAVLSTATVVSLRSALDWRKHTYEVLLNAQSFVTSIADIQRGTQGYLLTGRPDLLASYERGARIAPRQLTQLILLTRDNPAQQERIKEITAHLAALLSYSTSLLGAHDHEGLPAAVPLEVNGEGERITSRIAVLEDAFMREEQRLLVQRSADADADFHRTARILGFSGVMAAMFLSVGTVLVRREILRRHRLELELREATENVNTLSGMLPICAHCKSIRDDKGYWNRIEAYIQERSEARFSHGLCENCVKELYPDIADKVISKMRDKAAEKTVASSD